MTEKGDPYENSIAERVNGILKEEFALDREFENFGQAQKQLTTPWAPITSCARMPVAITSHPTRHTSSKGYWLQNGNTKNARRMQRERVLKALAGCIIQQYQPP